MINTIIIDNNQSVCDLLTNYLKENINIKIVGCFNDFTQLTKTDFDLIIFDINNSNFEKIIEYINKIKKINPKTKFVATSYEMNSNLVTKTLSNGIDDFLIKPILKNILETSINKIFLTDKEKNISFSKAISIFSSKGGIGKTSIAVNLAYEIEQLTKKNVCILDLSFNGENCANYLNVKQTNFDFISSVLKEGNKDFIFSLLPKYEDTNMYVLSFQEDININAKLDQIKLQNLINSIKNMFDYTIIDSSSFIDEKFISVLNCSNLILYVTLLNTVSINATIKNFDIFNNVGYNKNQIKLLINRYSEDLDEQLEILEKKLDKIADYELPNNYLTIIDAINQTKTIKETNPNSNISKAFNAIANDIINLDMKNVISNNCTIFNLLQRMGD